MADFNILGNTLFILLASTGISVWLIGLFVAQNQPMKANSSYGYRTPQSMKSQEAWDYAQVKGTKRMIRAAKIMCLLSLLALLWPMPELESALIGIGIILVALFVPLILTERELKEKF